MTMSQENFLIAKKIQSILSNLQSGLPVIYKNHLIFSAEFFDHAILQILGVDDRRENFEIIITDKRAISLGFITKNNQHLKLICTNDDIGDLINNAKLSKNIKTENLDHNEVDCAKIAIELMKMAKILPLIVIYSINENKANELSNNYEINTIFKKELNRYNEIKFEYVREVCRSKIILKDAFDSEIIVFEDFPFFGKTHLAIIIGEQNSNVIPLIRIHSGCYTGDLLKSLQCDCHEQLHKSIECMQNHWMKDGQYGIIIYQAEDEGRAIGLRNKIRTYGLQKMNHDTISANHAIGYEDDERNFTVAMKILTELRISECDLITNNPKKVSCFVENNILVRKRVILDISHNQHNKDYLDIKREKMNHLSSEERLKKFV